MQLFWSIQAKKDFRTLPAQVQGRIAEKMRWYASQPEPLHFTKALAGMPGLFRFRIGDYRIIVSPDGTILVVLRVHKRSEAYR